MCLWNIASQAPESLVATYNLLMVVLTVVVNNEIDHIPFALIGRTLFEICNQKGRLLLKALPRCYCACFDGR